MEINSYTAFMPPKIRSKPCKIQAIYHIDKQLTRLYNAYKPAYIPYMERNMHMQYPAIYFLK